MTGAPRTVRWTLMAVLAPLLAACAAVLPPRSPVAPPSAKRELILAQRLVAGEGPIWLMLDTSEVYRLEGADSVALTPRVLSDRPPLFRSPLFGEGVMVLPGVPGMHRLDAVRDVTVRIFREEYDVVELACIRSPGTEPCRRLRHGRTGPRLGVYLIPVFAVTAYLFWTKD
jgi:hypothetical protein